MTPVGNKPIPDERNLGRAVGIAHGVARSRIDFVLRLRIYGVVELHMNDQVIFIPSARAATRVCAGTATFL